MPLGVLLALELSLLSGGRGGETQARSHKLTPLPPSSTTRRSLVIAPPASRAAYASSRRWSTGVCTLVHFEVEDHTRASSANRSRAPDVLRPPPKAAPIAHVESDVVSLPLGSQPEGDPTGLRRSLSNVTTPGAVSTDSLRTCETGLAPPPSFALGAPVVGGARALQQRGAHHAPPRGALVRRRYNSDSRPGSVSRDL